MGNYVRLSIRFLIVVAVVLGIAIITAILAPRLIPAEWEPEASRVVIFVGPFVAFVAGLLSIFKDLKDISQRGADRVEIRILPGAGAEDQLAQRNRRAMLELVKSFWVKGALEQSLHGAALLALGMEVKPDAVEHPWGMVVQTPGQPSRPLPRGTRIVEVFERMNRALLILGEPGSGKTTLLLELARDTIARAEKDPAEPIPVVFNLSSWGEKRRPISDWLVDEFYEKYNVRQAIARPWVENDDLLLLLDGLDELKEEPRAACLEALNHFRQEHGFVSIAVCSRTEEYQAMNGRLSLRGAVVLQPLADWQIDDFLAGAGSQLLAVRQTLLHDTTLRELVRSPLFLSVMTLAYRGMSAEGLGTLDSVQARRMHVLRTYVQRMFEHRRGDERYSREESIRWLAWLAQRLSDCGWTIFLVERMRPNWLEAGSERRLYRLVSLLTVWLYYAPIAGLAGWVLGGVVLGLVALVAAPLVVAVVAGLLLDPLEDIELAEVLGWSWRAARLEIRKSVPAWSTAIAVVGLAGGVLSWLADGLPGGVRHGLVRGLGGALGGMLVGLAFICLSAFGTGGLRTSELATRMYPNQGIWRPARNAVFASLFLGLILGVIPGLFIALSGGMGLGFHGGLLLGLVGVMLGFACFGGDACVRHFAMRFILCVNRHLPRNYVDFLDYAAERILLRKVGSGYVFIHRLLQDYLAGLEPD